MPKRNKDMKSSSVPVTMLVGNFLLEYFHLIETLETRVTLEGIHEQRGKRYYTYSEQKNGAVGGIVGYPIDGSMVTRKRE